MIPAVQNRVASMNLPSSAHKLTPRQGWRRVALGLREAVALVLFVTGVTECDVDEPELL